MNKSDGCRCIATELYGAKPSSVVVTTPIYYINGAPHIGHAYASIAADVIARFHRLDGSKVHLSTGTDEHGIKVARSAETIPMDVQKFADQMSDKFREMNRAINLSEDDFIRTTENRHRESAQALWKLLEKDIYKDTYSGWYSARDEEYVAAEDVVDGNAPSGAPVEWMEEESYFFRLSAYQDRLLDYYDKHPDFIAPPSRRNEVINFVKNGLRDFSISRNKFDWGVPVPDSNDHVMYVWIDALANYITSLGFPHNREYVSEMMANCIHVVGKEILRFHAVYWPAFLMSAGISVPKRVFAHGWWVSEGQKMSKSIGNVVDPFEIIEKCGIDSLRYFLLREIRFGEDGDFSNDAFQRRISYDLANDLGNLVQRVLVFIQKLDGRLSVNYDFSSEEQILFVHARGLWDSLRQLMEKQDLHGALCCIWDLVSESNKFINDMRPWELARTDVRRLNAVLTTLCESIRAIAFGLAPFMPGTARKIFDFMNVEGKSFRELSINFSDVRFDPPAPLFPRER
ncbi:MAG: methionine--tRNA ligase [Holosporaceae bacterium]|jgi:methionyl-tRNA synthetase|nr:methionine--tRNA ligase [Holosporaceae bacterium]